MGMCRWLIVAAYCFCRLGSVLQPWATLGRRFCACEASVHFDAVGYAEEWSPSFHPPSVYKVGECRRNTVKFFTRWTLCNSTRLNMQWHNIVSPASLAESWGKGTSAGSR